MYPFFGCNSMITQNIEKVNIDYSKKKSFYILHKSGVFVLFNYDRLQESIKQSGKTKTYLCEKMGKPNYYLRDVIKQKNKIPEELQKILANELGVTVEWLNGAESAENPPPVGDGLSEATLALLDEVAGMNESEIYHLIDVIRAVKGKK